MKKNIFSERRPHSFHLCKDRYEFVKKFPLEVGVSIEDLVNNFVCEGAERSVLLTGSISQNSATAVSDVDFLVVVDMERSLRQEIPEMIKGDKVLHFQDKGSVLGSLISIVVINGIEIDFQFVDVNRLKNYLDLPAGYSRFIKNEGDLITLYRIRNSWVIDSEVFYNNTTADIDFDSLALFCTCQYYVLALKFLEDSLAFFNRSGDQTLYLGVKTVEMLFRALLSHIGLWGVGLKWLWNLSKLKPTMSEDITNLVDFLRPLLFPDQLAEQKQLSEYLEKVTRACRDVRKIIEKNPTYRIAFAYSEQIYDV